MHHVPVVGTRLADDHKIGVNVGNGKARFVQFVDQCAFTDNIGFFSFLATQEIGGSHGGGIKHAVRNIDTCGGKAVCQILSGLRRVVSQQD
ncbi:hypothetical protein D3C81_1945810 [compost metagenome]